MGFITLILGNKNLVIGLILVALLAGTGIYIKVLKNDISNLTVEKNNLAAELQISQASVKGLQQAITDQNTAIDKLKSDADTRVAAHQAEIAKAKNTAELYRKQAQYLMTTQAPQDKPKCDSANNLINQEIKNAK